MIICHPLKLIFIKTKKVGGTSFEIALSSFCDDTSVITPISPEDEEIRASLGYPGAQNYQQQSWPDGSQSNETFFNHIPLAQAKDQIPPEIWNSYTKVTIWRDPYDYMISRYYFAKMDRVGLPFGDFVQIYRNLLSENRRIAPLEGPDSPDVFLRYEHLEEDIAKLGVEGLWERFSSLKSKGNFRPKTGTDPETLYKLHLNAADIVEEQCAAEIRKFGYQRPVSPLVPAPASDAQTSAADFIFTLSAGRTGTAWLAQFLGDNLQINSIHEPLGLDHFGKAMPEIRHMRTFNTWGMDGVVWDFWQKKFASLQAPYAESNHTLGKCGLIEALAENSICKRSTVIILRRDLAKQCASYVGRNDFQKISIVWQWYLDASYSNRIVNPEEFVKLGQIGWSIWYALEMEARYAYYKMRYGDRVNFVEAKLEEITKPEGAAKLLASLGHHGQPILPEKKNHTKIKTEETEALVSEIQTFLNRLDFDPVRLAQSYLRNMRSLSAPSHPKIAA